MSHLRPAFTLLLLLGLLTGAAYPLLVTGLAQTLFPQQARGSLIERESRVIGSTLIAQRFTSPRYFHPRPSAAGADGYDAASSSGSNLGPTSRALHEAIAARTLAAQADAPGTPVPLDRVTASASGLDPHLSPAAARHQVARVARARGLEPARVAALVEQHVEAPQWGVLGQPRVNVLRLNLALDAIPSSHGAP